MTSVASDAAVQRDLRRQRRRTVSVLGVTQVFAWGCSYYLPTVLADPIAADTGWRPSLIVGCLSLGLLVAGLASPLAGRAIARHGGRPVLAAGAGALALGLVILALAPTLAAFASGWVVIGLGMALGLYDPAFATLGRLYGEAARPAITSVTLFGGFASTVCWPLTAFLEARVGWRGTCLTYAAFELMVALPLFWLALPREAERAADVPTTIGSARRDAPGDRGSAWILVLVGTVVTLSSVVSATVSVHLVTILTGRGVAFGTAVAFGTMIGPAQVAARSIEMAVGRFHHPIWTKLASTSLVAVGLALLWSGGPAIAVALLAYGAGIGLESIARGTLPLAVFGPERYPGIMGRISRPSLIGQALAPSAAALAIERFGVGGCLSALLSVAAVNLAASLALYGLLRQTAPAAGTAAAAPNERP